MKLSRYTVFHSDGSKIYLYHQLSRELLCIDQELADVLKSDDFSTLPTELANYLHSVHILVDNDLEESDIIRTANIRSRFQSKILRVTIMPTLNCNFHCWYCYEQHFESVLSSENVTALLTFIKAEALSKNKEMILLDWFGGEPLLHFDDIIYPITKELNAWGKENDVRIFSIITTNGSLINEDMVEKMREIELNQFQITLDGGRTFHNKTRYNSLMKDSYSVIINNIHLLYTLNPNAFVELRINYTPQNVISLSSILDDIAIELRPKILLSPHIVWQTAAKQEEMQTELDDFFSLAHEKGFYTKNDEVRSRCTSCYVDNADQYVINYDLTVYKCTARDFNKQFAIGEISEKGNFIPNALYYKYLLTEPSFVNKECLSCDVLPVCLNSNLCLQKKIEGVTLPCAKEKVKQSLSEMIARKIRDLNHKNPLLLVLVLCFSLFFQTLRAQENTGSLRGKIIDSKQENVAAATLLLQRPQDSVYYKSTTTDADGNYRITDIAAGEYELTVYSIGYSEQSRKVQIGNEELVVNFTLTEKLEAIDQVRISRQYSRYLPTGELFVQVRKNPLAIGQSTLDFLRHVRGVLVRDNEILILGRRGTEVYINDRPASFEELAAVPTTMVENIEVVEQAGAEYGVLGHGIIKVTLRDEGGLIGSVHGRVALRTEGYAQTSVDNSLQYHKGKFTVYNTISAKHNNSLTRSRQELASSKYLLRTQGDGTGYTLNDNLGLQLKIKTRHTLSVYGGVGLQNSDATLCSKHNETEVLRRENTLRSLDYNGGLFYHYKIPYGKLSYFSLRSTLSSEDESDSQLYTSNGNTRSKETYKMSHATTELKLRLVNESGHVFNFGAYGGYLPNQRRLEGNFGSSLPGLQNISTEDNSYSYRVWGEYRKSFTRFTLRVGLTHYARRYTLRDNVSDRDTVQRQ